MEQFIKNNLCRHTLLVVGVGYAIAEMYRALAPVELESRFVTEIVESIERLAE